MKPDDVLTLWKTKPYLMFSRGGDETHVIEQFNNRIYWYPSGEFVTSTDFFNYNWMPYTPKFKDHYQNKYDEKYDTTIKRLKAKLYKGRLTNREESYNNGILCAISIFRSAYKNDLY